MFKKKISDDDDGRTIADMSGVSRQSLFVPSFKSKTEKEKSGQDSEEKPWENVSMTKKEGLAFAFGAMSAAALISIIFIIGALIVILLFYFFGK